MNSNQQQTTLDPAAGFAPAVITALLRLGQRLNAAHSRELAARAISEAAGDLFGWDACFLNLYLAEHDVMYPVVNIDTINGSKTDVPSPYQNNAPSPMARRVLEKGAELVLRPEPYDQDIGAIPFGDTRKPSASIMSVPVRNRERSIGILSIQSYTPNAYRQEQLATLQLLADQCCGALERIRNAEALRASEEHFCLASRASSMGSWVRDLASSRVTWSPELEELFGLKPGQFGGATQDFLAFVHPEDRPRIAGVIAEADRTRREYEVEYRYLRADGQVRWMVTRARTFFDDMNQPVRVAGIGMDITERKRVENRTAAFGRLGKLLSCAASQKEAARIIGDVADSLFGWDAYSLDLYNAKENIVESVINVDVIADKRREVTPAYDDTAPSATARRVIDHGGRLMLREAPCVFSAESAPFGDNSRPSASLMYVPIRSQETVIGLLSIQSYTPNAYTAGDLSELQTLADHCGGAMERIHAAEKLRESEERFRTLCESSPLGIFATDAEGQCIYNNTRLRTISEFSGQEFLGAGWAQAVHPEDRARVVAAWEKAFAEGGEWSDEHRLITMRGNMRWVRALARPVPGADGKCQGYVGTVEDITERKQAEQALQQAHAELEQRVQERTRKLQESLESLETFCYSIAHDLRAPLRAMQGLTALLLEDYASGFDQTGRDYADRIVAAAHRMDRLIVDLLQFGRIGHEDLPLIPVHPEKMIRDILRSVSAQVLGKNAEIEVRHPLPRIKANPILLNQIFTNLLSNALKFVSPGVSPRICIWTEGCGGFIRFLISDNGIGISEENRDRVFRVFERLHGPELYPGTGMGLAIVRKATERMGGKVGFTSEVDKGSCFWVDLPKID